MFDDEEWDEADGDKETIRVPYNRELKTLETLLSGVRRPGDFFVEASLETAMPRIEIQGVGVLSFPVPETQIAQMIQAANRAPFGRGERTILDESVRKVWQLPPEKVRLGGKSWDKTFAGILGTVTDGLGCAEAKVSAELYKLLVYDRGGFFKAHRDTEKVPGMFGTLIVVLPSAHEGGELVIRHASREVRLDLSGAEVSELRLAAFYADCEHEVLPVTRGHRVCLVYNLVQQRAGKGGGARLTAPAHQDAIGKAAGMLREAFAAKNAPAKLAWLFRHEYSPAALSFAGLKGEDVALAKVLRRAAEEAGCAVHLGIVHIEETGPAEPDYSNYRGGWGGYDDDEGADEDADFEVVEVHQSLGHIGEWHDTEDHPVGFGDLPLKNAEVLPAGALDGEKPDQQKVMEATGNEGATFERSYHRAALVVWPRDRFADVLLQAGVAAVLPYLAERIQACGGAKGTAAQRKPVLSTMRRVIKEWEGTLEMSVYSYQDKAGTRPEMIGQLLALGDAGLLERFVGGVVTRRYDGSENDSLVPAALALGAQVSAELFSLLAREKTVSHPGEVVRLLGCFLRELDDEPDAAWKKALTRMGAAIVAALPGLKPRPGKKPGSEPATGSRWTADFMRQELERLEQLENATPAPEPGKVDAGFVTGLLTALRALGAGQLRAEAAAAITAGTAAFDPVTVVVPALTALQASFKRGGKQPAEADADLARLWCHCAEFLLARSGQPPVPPADWAQKVAITHQCADCRALQDFARNPSAREHRFVAATERRRHLHQTIDRLGLDMTHETERKGRPYTLVGVKTLRTFENACARHATDAASMDALLKLPHGTRDLTARLTAAAGRKPLPCPLIAKR